MSRRNNIRYLQFALLALALLFVLLTAGVLLWPSRLNSLLPDPPMLIQTAKFQGFYQEALYYVARLAADTGWTAALHRQAGDIWYEAGDTLRALPHYEAAAVNTEDDELLRRLGRLYLETGQPAKALTAVERLLLLKSADEWGQYQAGVLLAASDPRRARFYLQPVATHPVYGMVAAGVLRVLQTTPADSRQSFRVAAALARLKQYQYAEWAFQYAADLNYPFPEALAYAGWMRDIQGKDGSAAIAQALQLNPNSPDVWMVQGMHLRLRQDFAGSELALMKALTLDPQNPAIHAELGATYRATGQLEDAAYWLQSAVEVSDNAPALRDLLLQFYADEAYFLPDEALAQLSQHSGEQPNSPEVLSAYGWALHLTGDSALGLAKIDEALALDPNNARTLYDKARVLLEMNRPEEARPLLERVATGESPYADSAKAMLTGLK